MDAEEVARLIRAGLPGAQVRVQTDDNTHFAARIVAREFTQLRAIARHQLVYAALGAAMGRSEEHTSELQSHSDLVCRLLLEKKKKKKKKRTKKKKKIKETEY